MDNTKYKVEKQTFCDILKSYGFTSEIANQKKYLSFIEANDKSIYIKLVFGLELHSGQNLIVKLFHEEGDTNHERIKIEKQSIFSELLRSNGIKTPKRYKSNDKYTSEYPVGGEICIVTVEDWCGEEIREINTDIAYQVGVLMARIHTIAIESGIEIGSKTLFCAISGSDVDAYSELCEICKNERLNQEIVAQIKSIHDDKLKRICDLWETLPKAATQGDYSINNLTMSDDGIIVFDYNNAGDEVLISDLILEGLLTAYEMDLPEGTSDSYINELFLSVLHGYFSVRKLNDAEKTVAWDIYTLYNALWFSKIVHRDKSLEKLAAAEKFDEANALLSKMLSDLTAENDGRFETA